MQKQKALFLDRDGIINVDYGYVHTTDRCVFYNDIFPLCQYFKQQGYLLIIITNQSGINRGYYHYEQYQTLTQYIHKTFASNQVPITQTYHCPHTPNDNCNCRKPLPGLFLKAQKEHNIDLQNAIMIGDKVSDMQAAMHANIPTRYYLNSKKPSINDCIHVTHHARIPAHFANISRSSASHTK